MEQFIDKDALVLDISNTTLHITGMRNGKTIMTDFAQKIREALITAIENAPTEDVERIRHGAWVTIGKSKSGSPIRMCSYCNRQRKGINKSAYCRDCGAKMDLLNCEIDI